MQSFNELYPATPVRQRFLFLFLDEIQYASNWEVWLKHQVDWEDKRNRDLEVDLIAEIGDRIVPFEVKYQDADTSMKRLKGLRLFLEEHKVKHGYVITQRWDDFKLIKPLSARHGRERDEIDASILAIPAPLACYWLSGGFAS